MKSALFVDTDVVLDLLAARQPHYPFAARLFSKADKQEITICISSLSFSNLNYILSKQKGAKEARKILARFKVLVDILPVDEKVIQLALSSDFKDFEDAIQYFCAIEYGVSSIITCNLQDYRLSQIPVLTAEEYVKQI